MPATATKPSWKFFQEAKENLERGKSVCVQNLDNLGPLVREALKPYHTMELRYDRDDNLWVRMERIPEHP